MSHSLWSCGNAIILVHPVIVLLQATTPALFDNMKREIKARQDGGWKSVRWSMVTPPKLGRMDILHGRIMAQNPKVFCRPPAEVLLGSAVRRI